MIGLRALRSRNFRKPSSFQVRALGEVAKLPELPYDYNALEPYISGEIMTLHHTKHHQTYINSYNQAMENRIVEKANSPEEKQEAQGIVDFNYGGFVNHCIFWQNLVPSKDYKPPSGDLQKAIDSDFGNLDNLTGILSKKAAGIQGSGWSWLSYNKDTSKLQVATTANQGILDLVNPKLVPILGIDMWEHAFYLQYKNVKVDYLKNIWNVINWEDVAARYANAKK